MKMSVWALVGLAVGAGSLLADAPAPGPEPVRDAGREEWMVDVTCVLPADGPAVERGNVVARFYEYDPRIADRAATEIARVEMTGISHRTGEETVLRFPCAGKTAARKAYYVTIVIYPEGAAADRAGLYFIDGFQRVLEEGSRDSLNVTLSPVDKGDEPSN